MTPINTEIPKGLIYIEGETLIERLIKQLHEIDVYEIIVVVGYMKAEYKYLVKKYGIKLVENNNFMGNFVIKYTVQGE